MGLRFTGGLIDVIDGARRNGLDVTTECYPYTAASTGLESAIFDPGWQKRLGITYKDLQWAETGERLTAETFPVTVFDPGRIVDRATFDEPLQASEGVRDLLVNGVLVIRDGRLQPGVAPGMPVRAPIEK
jgi:dihydroorotase